MRATLIGEATYTIAVDPPPPAHIVRYGKCFTHCGVTVPEGVAVYRVTPFGEGKTAKPFPPNRPSNAAEFAAAKLLTFERS